MTLLCSGTSVYLNTELGKQGRLLVCNANTKIPTSPTEFIFTQHTACSLLRLIPDVRGNLKVHCMYRICKCDGSHEYLNKSLQVYLGTDYLMRDGLRTESFPNTSWSQRAMTGIPCMSYMTGQVVGAPAPLELSPDSRYCQAAPGTLLPTLFNKAIGVELWLSAHFHNICSKIIISVFQICPN